MAKSKKPKKSAKAKKPAAAKKTTTKKPAAKGKKPAPKGKKPAAPKAKGKKPAVKKSSKPPKTAKKSVRAKAPVMLALDLPPPPDGGTQTLAAPQLTSPTNNSSQTGGQNLAVGANINLDSVNYQLELVDVSGAPPFPAPYTQTVTITQPATSFTATIPAAQVQAGKTYQLKVKVHPSSGNTPPHGTHQVTFTT